MKLGQWCFFVPPSFLYSSSGSLSKNTLAQGSSEYSTISNETRRDQPSLVYQNFLVARLLVQNSLPTTRDHTKCQPTRSYKLATSMPSHRPQHPKYEREFVERKNVWQDKHWKEKNHFGNPWWSRGKLKNHQGSNLRTWVVLGYIETLKKRKGCSRTKVPIVWVQNC
jgi:hypothetical protein